ncbi:MAG: DNA-protecting protein DprA [Erysipelotrichaceae bacterium]|nr:DNA-protecting protein DprA [Erysipelotrichaceae bacterium]
MTEKMLLTLALKYNGDFNSILDAIKNHEDIDYDAISKYKNKLRYKYTTIISKDYPEFLKDTDYPPIVLFYEGNTSLMNKQDTMIYSVNSNKHRFIISSRLVEIRNDMMLDYCVACENQKDLDEILSYIKRGEIGIRNYENKNKNNPER